jgi:hypothetical protein
MCVLFYSSFICVSAYACLQIQGSLRDCQSIQSGAVGLNYYCAPLACIPAVIGLPAVWRHNKPKNNNRKQKDLTKGSSKPKEEKKLLFPVIKANSIKIKKGHKDPAKPIQVHTDLTEGPKSPTSG